MEKYLEGETPQSGGTRGSARQGDRPGHLHPGVRGFGDQAAGHRGPHGRDRLVLPRSPPRTAPCPTADGGEVHVDTEGAVSALVFKTIFDPYVGRLNFVKILSGELKPGSELINARTGKKERVAHVLKMVGKETSDIDAAPAGDVVVLPKLGDVITGDTLSEKGDVAHRTASPARAALPGRRRRQDQGRRGQARHRDQQARRGRADAATQARRRDAPDGALGIGRDRHRRGALPSSRTATTPRPNSSTCASPTARPCARRASAQGRHKKQTGGSGQFADCWLRVEPNHGKGYEFLDEIVGGKISKPYIVGHRQGRPEHDARGRARRLPDGRREGRRLRRLDARGRLERDGVPHGRTHRLPRRRREGRHGAARAGRHADDRRARRATRAP